MIFRSIKRNFVFSLKTISNNISNVMNLEIIVQMFNKFILYHSHDIRFSSKCIISNKQWINKISILLHDSNIFYLQNENYFQDEEISIIIVCNFKLGRTTGTRGFKARFRL